MEVLRAPGLSEAHPALRHAFSGSLRTPEDHRAFLSSAGLGDWPAPLRLRQVHGARVVDARAARRAGTRLEGDALVSDLPRTPLAVATADCVPVLLADPAAGVTAAVHAGWRGLRSRVLFRALEAMAELGAKPSRVRAALGPAVQGSCYVVGPEVRGELERAFPGQDGMFHDQRLDLVRVALGELARAGVPGEAVSVLALCTHCRQDLASHRREGAARGTNLAVIAMGA